MGRVVREHEGDRLWILDGTTAVDDTVLYNEMPVPIEKEGDVRLVFSGTEGVLEVVGGGIRIEVTGEAVFVEEFPGS